MTTRQLYVRVVSSTAAAVSSRPVRVAGQQVSVQLEAPTSTLGVLQISGDTRQWFTGNSRLDGSTGLTALAQDTRNELYERPEWVRCQVATDSSGPQNFDFLITTREEE